MMQIYQCTMDKYGLIFHHLGLAVTYPDKAVNFLKGMGYAIGESVFDEPWGVSLIFCAHKSMPNIELVYQSSPSGVIDDILKNFSEVIYHVGYSCNDLNSALAKIESENRVVAISKLKPAILFCNKFVSFYKVAGFGLIEIIEDGIDP